jgi:hypothetical protein
MLIAHLERLGYQVQEYRYPGEGRSELIIT